MNLWPPVPETGALPNCATRRSYSRVLGSCCAVWRGPLPPVLHTRLTGSWGTDLAWSFLDITSCRLPSEGYCFLYPHERRPMASYLVLSSRQYFQVLVSPSHVAPVVLACCWGGLTSPSDTGFSYLRALPIGATPGVLFPHLCQYGVRLLSLPPPCDRGGPLIQFGPVTTVFPLGLTSPAPCGVG